MTFLAGLAFAVYPVGKGSFVSQCDHVRYPYEYGNEYASGASIPERPTEKAHCASHVHRVTKHAEREGLHAVLHEDAEVISEIRASNAQRICGRQNKYLSRGKEKRGE